MLLLFEKGAVCNSLAGPKIVNPFIPKQEAICPKPESVLIKKCNREIIAATFASGALSRRRVLVLA